VQVSGDSRADGGAGQAGAQSVAVLTMEGMILGVGAESSSHDDATIHGEDWRGSRHDDATIHGED
jgi:hypothetical protein